MQHTGSGSFYTPPSSVFSSGFAFVFFCEKRTLFDYHYVTKPETELPLPRTHGVTVGDIVTHLSDNKGLVFWFVSFSCWDGEQLIYDEQQSALQTFSVSRLFFEKNVLCLKTSARNARSIRWQDDYHGSSRGTRTENFLGRKLGYIGISVGCPKTLSQLGIVCNSMLSFGLTLEEKALFEDRSRMFISRKAVALPEFFSKTGTLKSVMIHKKCTTWLLNMI